VILCAVTLITASVLTRYSMHVLGRRNQCFSRCADRSSEATTNQLEPPASRNILCGKLLTEMKQDFFIII
jgi:hypothetical protein